MNSPTPIILCADDFGLNPQVCQGILQLVQSSRISAVSCMVNNPSFTEYAPSLLPFKEHLAIGLHLNLTEGQLISQPAKACFSLVELLFKAHLGWLDCQFIAAEFNKQLDVFIEQMGYLPDFIDGHQHIHQFPKIRTVVLQIYQQRLKSQNTFVRTTYPALISGPNRFKRRLLSRLGKELTRQLGQLGIPHNKYFAGIYGFAAQSNYRHYFRQWLSAAEENTLIMCHPGLSGTDHDPLIKTRAYELNYFLSSDFKADLAEFHVVLGKSLKLNSSSMM